MNKIKDALLAALFYGMCVVAIGMPSAFIASMAYSSSDRKVLIEAYNACLRTMSSHDIQTIDSFCSRLKDRI